MLLFFILAVLFIVPFFLFTGDRKQHRIIPWLFALLIMSLQTFSQSLFDYVMQFSHFAVLVVAVAVIRKKPGLWFYCISLPVVAGLLWYYYAGYAGVINPQWPVLIAAVVQIVTMYLSDPKKPGWKKIVANFVMVAIILIVMVACLPKYTYEAAKATITGDIPGNLVQPEKRETIYAEPAASPCVDRLYVFRFEDAGILSAYTFNPVTDEWHEW